MSSHRLRQVEEIFNSVIELPREQWPDALRATCGSDASLRAEVESLIQYADPPETFLSDSALGVALATSAVPTPEDELVGQMIGSYRITQRRASGGMGTVYRAARADGQFEQHVAIKVVKRGMDTEEILRRFHRERRTLAALSHPNIARLLDGGAIEDGRPYLVMEFVSGEPIDEYCNSRRLNTSQRLELFVRACEAVRFAHQNLVVHRDLKPGNVLVTADGTPKLLDFGISKVLGGSGSRELTMVRDRRYTPEYASPEQATGHTLTTATDIYSLGVILYELLTGHQPYHFVTRSVQEIERVVRDTTPVPPSAVVQRVESPPLGAHGGLEDITPESVSLVRDGTPERLRRRLRGDLDTIILKALHKDPARRYASVEQFVADIERHLSGMPVLARPDTFAYRFHKFVRRHALAVGAASVALLLLAVGFGSAVWQARVARHERDAAYVARNQAEATGDFLQRIMSAADPQNEGPNTSIRAVLDAATELVDSDLKNQPLVQAAVRSALGRTYLGLGLLDVAERNMEAAHSVRRSLLPPGHHDLAESQFDLAQLYYAQGQYAKAEEFLVRCLETHSKLRGPDSRETARALNDLGAVRRALRKIPEAEATLREALRVREKLSGRESLETAETLNNLSGVLRAKGDMKGALELDEEVLAIRQRLLRKEHPLVILSMANLAVMVTVNGDLKRGEQLLRQVVELDRKVFGNDHPALAVDLGSLARSLMRQNRPVEAEPILRESLEIRHRRLPANDERLLLTQAVLGECLVAQGRDREAEPLLADALHKARVDLQSKDSYWDDVTSMLEATRRSIEQSGEEQKPKTVAKPNSDGS